jgi:hypothetical protein
MADISKIPYREIEIDGVVSIPESVTEEDFWHEFIRWVEDKGYTFGGGINEIKSIVE